MKRKKFYFCVIVPFASIYYNAAFSVKSINVAKLRIFQNGCKFDNIDIAMSNCDDCFQG